MAAAPAVQTTNPSGNAYQMDMLGIRMIVLYNSQIIEGDYWWNLIQAIDPVYKIDRAYNMNRTLLAKFSDGSYGVFALDVFLNIANLIATSPATHNKMVLVEPIVQRYLVETIKQLGVTPEIANNIGFKLQTYTCAQIYNPDTDKYGIVPATTATSLGRKGMISAVAKPDLVFKFAPDWSAKPADKAYKIGPCFSKPTATAETQTQATECTVTTTIAPSSHIIALAHRFGF